MSQITYFKDKEDVSGTQTNLATRIEIKNGWYRIFRFDECIAETREPVYVDCKSRVGILDGRVIISLYKDE